MEIQWQNSIGKYSKCVVAVDVALGDMSRLCSAGGMVGLNDHKGFSQTICVTVFTVVSG